MPSPNAAFTLMLQWRDIIFRTRGLNYNLRLGEKLLFGD